MADVSIDQTDGFSQQVATNGQTIFDYDYPIFDESHIQVIRTRAGVRTILALTSNYTVQDVGQQAGGTITLTAGATAGDVMTMRLNVPEERTTDFQQAGDFFAKTLNKELDLQTQMIQQLRRDIDRAARLPDDSTLTGITFQNAPQDGYGFVWSGTAGLIRNTTASLAQLEGNASTVAGNITAVNTVATNIASVNTVASNISNVNSVAGNATNINSVAGNATNINAVAGNATNINAVAGNATNINTVATNITNINTVAGISGNVTTVAGISSAVSTVATNVADINTCAANIAAIQAAPGYAATASAAAAGLTAVANKYAYSTTTTSADPGTGIFRLNNATVASATALYISNSTGDTGNPSISAVLDTWDDSTHSPRGIITFVKEGTPATYAKFGVSGTLTANSGWKSIPLTYIGGNGTFSNADAFRVSFVPSGNDGTGTGDASTNTVTSVDSEVALFSGTGGKTLKRATATGIAKLTSGVLGTATAGTDYYNPGGTDVAVSDGGTGRSSHTAYAVICGSSSGTGAEQSIASVGSSGQALVSNGAGALPTFQTVASKMVAHSYSRNTTYTSATSVTAIPGDDTIPQSNEGYQFHSVSHTPASSTNILLIRAYFVGGEVSNTANGNYCTIWKDADANTLAITQSGDANSSVPAVGMTCEHIMVAGSTSAITFRGNASLDAGTTLDVNGRAGARKFGGISACFIEVFEFTP